MGQSGAEWACGITVKNTFIDSVDSADAGEGRDKFKSAPAALIVTNTRASYISVPPRRRWTGVDVEEDEIDDEEVVNIVGGPLCRQVTEEMWPSYACDRTVEPENACCGALVAVASQTSTGAAPSTRVTTLMLRNLPKEYTRSALKEEIDGAGFAGAFDFLHVPMERKMKSNRGYAFINFVNEGLAQAFSSALGGLRMRLGGRDETVTVAPARVQGLEENHAHFPDSCEMPGGGAMSPAPAHRRRRRGRSSLIDAAMRGKCGTALDISVSAETRLIAIAEQQPSHCPVCGGSRQADHRFCEFCGCLLPVHRIHA